MADLDGRLPARAGRLTVVSDFAVVYLRSGVMEREVDGRSWTLHAPLAYTRAPGMIERTWGGSADAIRGIVLSLDRTGFVESFGHCAGHDPRPIRTNAAIDDLLQQVSGLLAQRPAAAATAHELLRLTAEAWRAQRPRHGTPSIITTRGMPSRARQGRARVPLQNRLAR